MVDVNASESKSFHQVDNILVKADVKKIKVEIKKEF